MKVFYHFAASYFSNVYLVGPEGPGNAVLIDPGIFDTTLLRLIEDNGYYVSSVLVTHGHASHMSGLTTLLKIYQARVYAAAPLVGEVPATLVSDGDSLDLGGLQAQVISTQGHSRDSVAYRMGPMLFTGDAVSAGKAGGAPNAYSRALLIARIKEIFKGLPATTVIFPGHGPPSTVRAELDLNPEFLNKDEAPV